MYNKILDKIFYISNKIVQQCKLVIMFEGTPFIICFFVMLYLFNRVSIQPGDDVIFSQMANKYSLINYIEMRYSTWSNRITTDVLLYYFSGEITFLWKWFCALIMTFGSYKLYTIIIKTEKNNYEINILYRYLCCFGFGLISSTVLSSSIFWITGSINYLLPLSFGIIAISPFMYKLYDKEYEPNWISKIIYSLSTIMAAFGHEQVLVCLIIISMISIVILYKNNNINKLLYILILIDALAILMLIISPGPKLRYQENVNYYFPKFDTIGLAARIKLSICFTLQSLLSQSYLLLIIIWYALGIRLLRNNNIYKKILGNINIIFSILLSMNFIKPIDVNVVSWIINIYDKLYIIRYLTTESLRDYTNIIPYIIWTVGIIIIPISIIIGCNKKTLTLYMILIYLLSLFLIIVLSLSPTLYATGGRGTYISNMLLLILMIILLYTNKPNAIPLFAIILVAIIKIIMIELTWNIVGYHLWYGVLDIKNLPFQVMGK
jgi:hypothetical protein